MNKKIDWYNHLVAFVSTLLGIFIAFQLEDWKDNRKQEQALAVALDAIKKEVQANVKIYQTNVAALSEFLEYRKFYEEHSDAKGNLITSEKTLNRIRGNHPNRTRDLRVLRKLNDSINVYTGGRLIYDVLPVTGISAVNWKAASSSGLLTSLDHEKLSQLTDIYGWIERDMGMDESEYFFNAIGVSEFDDLNRIVENYERIMRNTSFKLARIEKPMETLGWWPE
ncbi:MAG TPA: hypothetical protein VGD65_12385 [Chryseosolibacter sp.]